MSCGDMLSESHFCPRDALLLRSAKKRPLILLSHGATSLGLSLMWLGDFLAQHGYIVAAVNHHGNTAAGDQILAQGFALAWERPGLHANPFRPIRPNLLIPTLTMLYPFVTYPSPSLATGQNAYMTVIDQFAPTCGDQSVRDTP